MVQNIIFVFGSDDIDLIDIGSPNDTHKDIAVAAARNGKWVACEKPIAMNAAEASHQLGHADVAVTARHYARWTGGDEYRDPVRLLPGEVPADLLARLALKSDPTSDPTRTTAEGAESANPRPSFA